MTEISKVVLIGFMASGKSAVAAELAPRLGFNVYQVDDEIVSRSGYPSVAALFAEKGEALFRELESEVALSLREAKDVVISTGGGIITRPTNMENLKSHGGIVVYLRTSFEIVSARAGDISSRPLFANKTDALELYKRRLPVYESYADIIVDTDGLSIEEVCSQIFSQLKSSLCT
jgi:shikimate kinase